MNLTSVDPPEVIRFVRKHYPEVELIKPKTSIYNLAVEKQILPSMKVRWCCSEYKETAGAGKVTLIGIRHQESSRRAKRKEVEISSRKYSGTLEGLEEYRQKISATQKRRGKTAPHETQGETAPNDAGTVANPAGEAAGTVAEEVNITNATEERTLGCISGKESLLISPIIHWTERDVWEFLTNVVRVPHCELYDQGFRRIGCIGCPMSNFRQKIIENQRWPHVKRNWIKAIMAIRHGGVFQGIHTRANHLVRHPGRLQAASPTCGKGQASSSTPTLRTGWKKGNTGLWAGFRAAPRLTA